MKKLTCFILVFLMAFSVLSLQAYASTPFTPSLTVTVSSDKSSYLTTGTAKITVIVKNVSSQTVCDVLVKNLFSEHALIINGKENLSLACGSLEPNDEIYMTLTVCHNPDNANINFLDRIILSLKVFFIKLSGSAVVEGSRPRNVYDDGFSESVNASQGIPLGKRTLWHTARVNYSETAVSAGTKEQIVAAYNTAANATKAYTGRITIADSGGVASVINKITGGNAVANLAKQMLPNFEWGPDFETFVDGKSMRHDYATLANSLPVFGEAYMSILEPAGVSSAIRIQDGSGWKYKIILAPETVDSLNGIPKYRAQCMNYLELDDRDLEPFKLKSVTVNYTEATITAYVNADGLLEKLHFVIPADIEGELSYGLIGVDVDITGTTTENYMFSYS